MEQSEQCAVCPEPAMVYDVLNFPWCKVHRHRGELINKGHALGWRELFFDKYAIGSSAYAWRMTCVEGHDEVIWLMLGYIEYLEEQSLNQTIRAVEAQIQAGRLEDAEVVEMPLPESGELAG